MKLLVLIIFILLSTVGYAQDCNCLTDGKYKVKITSNNYENFYLIIKGKEFFHLSKNGQELTGSLYLTDCDLILMYNKDKSNLDDSEIVKKLESLGEFVYELEPSNKQSFKFRLTRSGNRNILIYEGKISKG